MDVQHTSAIDIVLVYMDCRSDAWRFFGCLSDEEYSYITTACMEIIRFLQEEQEMPVLDVVSDYSRKMLGYYYRKHHRYFYAAHQTAEDIIRCIVNI